MQDHFGSPDSPPSDLGALPLRRRTTSECDGEAGPANAASPDFSARHVPQTAADILRQAGLRLGVGVSRFSDTAAPRAVLGGLSHPSGG